MSTTPATQNEQTKQKDTPLRRFCLLLARVFKTKEASIEYPDCLQSSTRQAFIDKVKKSS